MHVVRMVRGADCQRLHGMPVQTQIALQRLAIERYANVTPGTKLRVKSGLRHGDRPDPRHGFVRDLELISPTEVK
jgi:hypothetical protein